jgi:ankyrin repeat protein
MQNLPWLIASVLALVPVYAQQPSAETLFDAIRRNGAGQVKRLLDAGANAGAVDNAGTPAIMEAARFAGLACLRTLLDAGADPNAANRTGATALMWVIPDLGKAKLLIERGANVNARSTNLGLTPLLIASSYPNTVALLRYLLAKGAGLRATDRSNRNALRLAARSADVGVVRFLVEQGFEVNEPESGGTAALAPAWRRPYSPTVEYLLSKGAKIRPSDLALATPWMTPEQVAALIEKGGDVNARAGSFGRTPLIMAASSDHTSAASLDLLLERGADPNVPDADGETPLDWAMHSSAQAKIEILSKYGAKPATTRRDEEFGKPEGIADARTSLARSLELLLPSGLAVFRERACITCHNQTLPAQVATLARQKGVPVNDELAARNLRQIAATYRPIGEEAMQGADPPGQELTIGYVTMALASEGHPPDAMTAGLTHLVASRQMPEGNWIEFETRPPMEYSSISRTAMAVRTLTLYPIEARRAEIDERVHRAGRWLLAAKPASAEESAMRLMGLVWARMPRTDRQRAACDWIAHQREDGGWAQLPQLPSDAYATGLTLVALHEAEVQVTHDAYRKGIVFLLRTQHANGAWFVKTRAFPVQPQIESGYPFGYHQWISAAGASWASLAIGYTLP